MKKLLTISMLTNLALVCGALWVWQADVDVMRSGYLATLGMTESHVELHARSLKALESGVQSEIDEVIPQLRMWVETWDTAKKTRQNVIEPLQRD